MAQLLFHSTQLAKDIAEDAKRRALAQASNTPKAIWSKPGRSAGAPVKYRRR